MQKRLDFGRGAWFIVMRSTNADLHQPQGGAFGLVVIQTVFIS